MISKPRSLFLYSSLIVASSVSFLGSPVEGIAIGLCVLIVGSVFYQYIWPIPKRRQADLSDPLFLMGCIMVLFLVGRTYVILAQDFSSSQDMKTLDMAFRTVLGSSFNNLYLLALGYAFLLWICMVLGYRWCRYPLLNARYYPGESGIRSSLIVLMILSVMLVGWLCRIYVFLSTPKRWDASIASTLVTSPIQTLASAGSSLTVVALALAAALYIERKKSHILVLMLVLTCMECVFGLYSGERAILFTPFILMLSAWGRERPVKLSLYAALIAPVGVWAIGFTALLRLTPDASSGIGRAFSQAAGQALHLGPIEVMHIGVSNLLARYHGLDSVGSVVFGEPLSIPRWGLTYLYSLATPLIPRFIWGSKPRNTYGLDFARHYFHTADVNNTFMAPTWFGDVTLQFGTIISPLVFIIIGYGIGRFRRSYLTAPPVSFVGVLYLSIITNVVMFDGWLSSAVYAVVVKAILVYGVFSALKLVSRAKGSSIQLLSGDALEPVASSHSR